MSLVASTIPNLVSGVSQQPAPSRLRTSGETMENAFPSIVSGLMKRPPIEWQGKAASGMTLTGDEAVHFIDRSPTERYILVCGNGDLELYDLTGTAQTVTFPDGKAYLPTASMNEKLRFVTVADTTFVLNTDKTVSASAITDTRGDPTEVASIFIERAVPSVTYAIYVDGVLAGSFATSDNTTAATALEGTSDIASELATDLVANGYTDAEAVGTTVTFGITSGEVITVLDEYGGSAMTPYTDVIQNFEDLPPYEKDGRLVKVQGGVEEDVSAYWVIYDNGVWIETVSYNAKRNLDANTMPHILVKTAPNTFEFRENAWNERAVGDDDSNPDPSFVGSKLNSVFLHKGRLGILSEENMVHSAVAVFEDFYLSTALTVLDTDPIDVAAATGKVSTLRHAVSFADQLLLFSDRVQFRVTSGQVYSAESVGITTASAYPCSSTTPPVIAGSSSYFIADGATHSLARELMFEPDGETLRGENISVQVPAYVPKNVRNLLASETSEILVALSKDDPQSLYLYKWYTTERRKVQSAWSKWTVGPDDLIGIGFFDQHLYLVSRDVNEIRITRIAVGPTIEQSLLLDHYVTESNLASFTYDSGNDRTVCVLESGYDETFQWYRLDDNSGAEYENVTKFNNTTYYIPGDVTSHTLVGGLNYEFIYGFSKQYIREENSDGESAIQDGRLQLRYFSVIYTDSSYFEAHVTPTNGTTKTTIFNGRTLADPDNIADVIPRDTGEFKFPIFAQNEEVAIELRNNQPYRCAFGSVEWTASYRPKARRM